MCTILFSMGTIFFIPGMWTGKNSFENFKEYFTKKGYDCYISTLLYHAIGPEDRPSNELGTTSLTDYVDKLEMEYNQIDGDKIILGHSMGGLLAQLLAARVDSKALVLLSSAPPRGINALKYSVIKSYIGILIKPFFWRIPSRISFRSAKYAFLNNLKPDKQLEEYNKLVYESGRAMLQIGLPFLDSTKASLVDERDITCPVLILHGMKDRIVPYTTGVKIMEKYSEISIMKLFKNKAHLMQTEEGWEDTSGFIHSWLDNL